MPLSVIIPSRNVDNLIECIAALRSHDPLPIIVVDDGLDFRRIPDGVTVIPGVSPFIFARNINLGIQQAGKDDVFLLNDDSLLETFGGFTAIQQQWRQHPEYGLIGSAIDSCGTPEQHRLTESDLRAIKTPPVIFAACFIPRRTIDRIGYLDERFGVNAGGPGTRGYGCEDDDYCWRVRAAGLLLGVYDGCLVNHTKLKSTFRDDPEHKADVKIHEALFERKWGRHPRRPL